MPELKQRKGRRFSRRSMPYFVMAVYEHDLTTFGIGSPKTAFVQAIDRVAVRVTYLLLAP